MQFAVQAHYDFENAYVFHRLPWHPAPGDERIYNANFDLLVSLAEEELDYIIVRRSMQPSILDLLAHTDVGYETIFEDENVLIFELDR